MKINLLLFSFVFLSFSGWAQEEFAQEEGFQIGVKENVPALSELSSNLPVRHFQLSEVDIFNTDVKREVNMVAMMEKERRYKEREVDFESPFLKRERKEGGLEISDNIHLYNRGSNYDYYTGKKKNPVYEEMRPHLYNNFYSPYYARRGYYVRPYFR